MPLPLIIALAVAALGAFYYVSTKTAGATASDALPQILFTGSGSVPVVTGGTTAAPAVAPTGTDAVAASASVAKTSIKQTGQTAQMSTAASLFAGLTDALSKDGLSRVVGTFGTHGQGPSGIGGNQSFLDFSVFRPAAAGAPDTPSPSYTGPAMQTNTAQPIPDFNASWWNVSDPGGGPPGPGGADAGNAGDSGDGGDGGDGGSF